VPRKRVTPCLDQFWVGLADCRRCQSRVPVPFGGLESRQFSGRLFQIQDYHVEPGVDLVTAGEDADVLFTIREGFVKVWNLDAEDRPRILRLLGPGDVVGMDAMFQSVYSNTATSLTSASLCQVPVGVMARLRAREPALYGELGSRMHRQMVRTENLLSDIASGPARARIIKLLRHLSEFADEDVCPRISRADMAAMTGVASETAARVIADLKEASLLVETDEHLCFDPEQLTERITKV